MYLCLFTRTLYIHATKFDSNEENKKVLTLQLEPNMQGQFIIGEIEFTK